MLFSPSLDRCGDQFVEQNSSPRTPPPAMNPVLPQPKLFSPTQVQYESHPNNRKQEDGTPSRLLARPNYQSPNDFYGSPSSYESPDTDPAFTQAQWNNTVAYSESTYDPSNDLLEFSIMESTSRVLPQEYNPQGFSSAAFSDVLAQYQVTIREDWVVPPNLGKSFWAWFREMVSAAPAEVALELESCRVWEDNTEGTKPEPEAEAEAKAEAEDLAAKFSLVLDLNPALVDRHQFVTLQILPRCTLPGFRVYNILEILHVPTESYYFLPARESPAPSISTITRKSASPKFFTTPSVNFSKAVSRRSALPNTALPDTALPTNINPSTLSLPRDPMDCVYWLDASELWPSTDSITEQVFVSNGTIRKTSPYLSVVFENSDHQSFTEKKLLVNHKIAVYGSTALYNRRLLSIKASRVGKNSCVPKATKRASDLHFGLGLVGCQARLYLFQCTEREGRGEQHMPVAWHGCSMYTVGEWSLLAPDKLADMLSCLRIVAEWVRRVYVPGLRDDLTQLSNIFTY